MFRELLYRPFFNLTIALYNVIPGADLGIAIILMTLFIRVLLFPISKKALLLQRKMSQVNPKINELKEKYKNDKTAQSEALTRLYKDEGVNPLLGCLPLLVQIPIVFALYKVFLAVSSGNDLGTLYSFIERPEHIRTLFFGLVDTAKASPVLAILAGVFQFIQSKQASPGTTQNKKGDAMSSALNTQMLYFFPGMIIVISWNFPAGLTLYWITTTLFSIFEQIYIKKAYPPKKETSG